VRWRYAAGLRNFFGLYQPLTTTWRMYDTSAPGLSSLVARGTYEGVQVVDSRVWRPIVRKWS
jgi:hypothetical protein